MAANLEKVLVRGIPPRLKGKIARRVRDEHVSMNDVLAGVLAARYSLAYEPQGGPVRQVGASPDVMLYLPSELVEAIDLDAEASGDSRRNMIVRTISEAFNVPFTASRKPGRPRRRRVRAT